MNFADSPVTFTIIGLNILVFALINLKILDVKQLGTSYMLTVQKKQYYRLISSAFTQKEFLHLLCNMYSLYNIGFFLEKYLGTISYVISYVVITLLGGYISGLIHKKSSPFTLSIGSSGTLCGLLGIYLVIAVTVRGLSGIMSLLPTIVLLMLMTTSRKIDSIGHFTGLAVGIAVGAVLYFV